MNNNMMNRFTLAPTSLDMKRSRFKRPFKHITTFDAGKLIPFYWEEVLPGDTVSLDLAALVRAATPVHPVMDNAYLEFHFYFVPNRLVWTHWINFMGENTNGKWIPSVTYQVPQLAVRGALVSGKVAGSYGVDPNTVPDYLGIPSQQYSLDNSLTVSALPFRAYAKIWNDWYRSESLQDPVNIDLDDTLHALVNTGVGTTAPNDYETWASSGYVSSGSRGGAPLPVCKFFDYFTSSLPSPQKGPDVLLPLGNTAPLINDSTATGIVPLFSSATSGNIGSHALGVNYGASPGSQTGTLVGDRSGANILSGTNDPITLKVVADLRNATAASINTIRFAFQLQKYYERLARSGSRYNESIQAFFGVHVPDERLQRPEFLGGRRIPLNMTQVAQTSETGTTPKGSLAAYSQTADNHSYFTKSFVEDGILMGLCFVRTDRTYQQGINKAFFRKDRVDYYKTKFYSIGEQAIKNQEIYVQAGTVVDSNGVKVNEKVFGYQEAWAEYRYSPNRISGDLRSSLTSSLDSWHYGDNYSSLPVLGASWIREPQAFVSRTLALPSEVQYIADIQIDSTWTRVMPLYSIPGLVDHH